MHLWVLLGFSFPNLTAHFSSRQRVYSHHFIWYGRSLSRENGWVRAVQSIREVIKLELKSNEVTEIVLSIISFTSMCPTFRNTEM